MTMTFGFDKADQEQARRELGEYIAVRQNEPLIGRTIQEILLDAMQHQVDEPTHGTNCVCMDKLVQEMREVFQQVFGGLPAFQQDGESTGHYLVRHNARHRADYVLRLAMVNK